jgi:hypothetical protein
MARGGQSTDWRSSLGTSAGTGAVPPSTGPIQDNPAAQTDNLLMTDNLKNTLMPTQQLNVGANFPKPAPGVQKGPGDVPGAPPKPTSGTKMMRGY